MKVTACTGGVADRCHVTVKESATNEEIATARGPLRTRPDPCRAVMRGLARILT